ncbi:unnamed protein product [Caenorhabditis sp. 36 PRJEB53466]|nr:unnamed protein product [Caenorhabditis sp. 36 PRJEB53466]
MMLHFILLIIPISTIVKCDNTMTIVWGKPSALTNALANTSLTWDQCVSACYTAQRCVLAYQNATACNMFNYNVMPTVTQENSTLGNMVAFKVTSLGDTCPVGVDAPTFNKTNATGYLLTNDIGNEYPAKIYYNISLSGTTWKLSYLVSSSCVSPSVSFIQHSDGSVVCIAIYISNGSLSYTDSVAGCKTLGATLLSINYPADALAAVFVINYYYANFKTTNFYVRIDGQRTTACQSAPNTAACVSGSGFNFTDLNYKGSLDYYNWTTNSSAKVAADDHCIVYAVLGSNSTKADVRSCTNKSPYLALGHLCAKTGWS